MNKINAVVIDDEHFNRGLITMLITRLNGNYEIVGEAENVEEGYELINKTKPNVVFLDIKMQGGTGFDLLALFEKIDFEIVFVTGFDEYVLKAFELNAVDYVLKPIDLEKFRETLGRVEARVENNLSDPNGIMRIMQSYDTKTALITHIPIYANNSVILLAVDEVMYFYSEENGTVFIKNPSGRHFSQKPFVDFEFIIANFHYFIKTGKTTYINANYIRNQSKGSDYFVTMFDGQVMDVPDHKKEEVITLLSAKKNT